MVEKEVIFAEDVERIFGKRPWTSRSEEIMAAEEGASKTIKETENFDEKEIEEKPPRFHCINTLLAII